MQVRKEDIREYLYTQGGVSREVLSEREIAEQFDIKRNHARELLLELVGEGVVERHPRSGYRYVDYRGTRPGSAIMMRYTVELEAAAVALDNADREDEVRIMLAADALDRAAAEEDLAAYIAADREFHTALVRASHDNMLIRIFEFLQSTLFRRAAFQTAFSEPHRATQRAHKQILQAFLDRDGAKLQTLLKRHLNYWGLQPRLKEFSAPLPPDSELLDSPGTEC